MIRCAITDIGSDAALSAELFAAARGGLLQQARQWAVDGVELVQLREKHLQSKHLLHLAEELQTALRGSPTRLLINGRPDVAIAAGAAGVHLSARSGELTAAQLQRLFAMRGLARAVVSLACHSLDEVLAARRAGVDFILFGPVFEKQVQGHRVGLGVGLAALRAAAEAAQGTPVLALGGVTRANMTECLSAGAAGVAAIRLFAG